MLIAFDFRELYTILTDTQYCSNQYSISFRCDLSGHLSDASRCLLHAVYLLQLHSFGQPLRLVVNETTAVQYLNLSDLNCEARSARDAIRYVIASPSSTKMQQKPFFFLTSLGLFFYSQSCPRHLDLKDRDAFDLLDRSFIPSLSLQRLPGWVLVPIQLTGPTLPTTRSLVLACEGYGS